MKQDTAWRLALDRLKTVMDGKGLSMRSVSLRAGLNEGAVKDLFNKGNVPSVENFAAICRAANTTVEAILYGETPPRPIYRIIGCASAGEEWLEYEDGLGEVELTASSDCIAIEVRGDSMFPVYRNGDVLIGERTAGRSLGNHVGVDCIVSLTNGAKYVKRLARGTKGRFTLESYNRLHPDMVDVVIDWAAPIIWVKRSFR